MGNQLSGIAPSQILPVENYIVDLNNKVLRQLTCHKSLGSTRFLKVVMCLSDRGPVVIKVFVIHDASLSLMQQKTRIKFISEKLSGAVNCLPFHAIEVTEKAAFIIRQYVKSSLYDRISTRPFLSNIEKKWLAFQLLCALNDCHKEQICHGDIKLENILVTSWCWLVLSDFASYKPVLLPDDNPTDFTYFFDSSRRRVCNVAPERFVKMSQKDEEFSEKETVDSSDMKLTHSMDIFSSGCVLIELFTEGFYPFNLMQLLQYRSEAYYPHKILEKISDQAVKEMLEEMISKNPKERRTAAQYLERERGRIFPLSFYAVLLPFCRQFVGSPGLTADERIYKMESSLPDVLNLLYGDSSGVCGEVIGNLDGNTQQAISEAADSTDHCNGANGKDLVIILASLVSSCVRALHFPSSKLIAMKLFRYLSKCAASDVILDRILPYILNLLKDPEPTVRADALRTATTCLTLVSSVPRSDANIFLEYVFPNMSDVTQDSAVVARQAEAANLSILADTALRFAEHCSQSLVNYSNNKNEVNSLQDIVQQKLAKLFSDPSSVVKRTLIDETLNSLCLFFGKEKANDVLLSHLITFLNEKKDYHLRLSFYKNITGIAAYMGTSCNPIWMPLLLQGLSDVEETVSLAAVETMSALTEIGIFPDHALLQLASDAAPLLIHPNMWIRQGVVGLVVAISKVLSFLDVHTSVASVLRPYFNKNVLQLDNEACILSALKAPLPRAIFDYLTKSADASVVIRVLREAYMDKTDVTKLASFLGEGNQPVKHAVKRLAAAGLVDSLLPLVFCLESHIVKVNRYRKVMDTLQVQKQTAAPLGVICQSGDFSADPSFVAHKIKLVSNPNLLRSTVNTSSSGQLNAKSSSSVAMNEEWRAMFGDQASPPLIEGEMSAIERSDVPQSISSLASSASSQAFGLENSAVEMTRNVPHCHHTLNKLVQLKREDLIVSFQSKKLPHDGPVSGPSSKPRGWRPKGQLVAHLHEHKGAITRLVHLTGSSLFASSSKDGTVRVWDANKTERTFPINRSKFTYNAQRGVITALTHCPLRESLAASADDGSVHVFSLEGQNLLTSRQLEKSTDGYALDLNYMNAGVHSLLTYSTVYGKMVGWDLRSPNNAWALDNDVRKGLITSYDIDPSNNWLCCGTSCGFVCCWDLRFLLPISQVTHLHGHSVQRLKMHPQSPSVVMTSFRGNNEVVLWDMETQSRTTTLWASPYPPLTSDPNKSCRGKDQAGSLDNWVHGLIGFRSENKGVSIVTAGTDSRIRFWDLGSPTTSYIIAHPALFSNPPCGATYRSSVIDGSEVITELTAHSTPSSIPEDSPRKGGDSTPIGHVETITDVIAIDVPQMMLVTSGYDGTVKMWK